MPTAKGTSRGKRTKRPAVRKPKPKAAKPAEERPKKPTAAKRAYVYAVGRRKSAVARVRYYTRGDGTITVNGKPLATYLPHPQQQQIVRQPLETVGADACEISVRVRGGGIRSQAESIRHGIARALLVINPATRIPLKRAGLLTRDARVKERKKYGLKRARRAPQWQKR